MTPRGLKQLTNAANKIEAWRDWHVVADRAEAQGHGALVYKYLPAAGANASWRSIDKARKQLEAALLEVNA